MYCSHRLGYGETSYGRQDSSNNALFLNLMVQGYSSPPVPYINFDSSFRAFFFPCSFAILCSTSIKLPLCLGPSMVEKLSSKESGFLFSEKTDPDRGVGVLVDAERLLNFRSDSQRFWGLTKQGKPTVLDGNRQVRSSSGCHVVVWESNLNGAMCSGLPMSY